MSCTTRKGEGERDDAAAVVFVLLNPHSAAVYCQHLPDSAPKAARLESGGEGNPQKMNCETTNHFSVYCKTYRKLARSLPARRGSKQVLFQLPGLHAVYGRAISISNSAAAAASNPHPLPR